MQYSPSTINTRTKVSKRFYNQRQRSLPTQATIYSQPFQLPKIPPERPYGSRYRNGCVVVLHPIYRNTPLSNKSTSSRQLITLCTKPFAIEHPSVCPTDATGRSAVDSVGCSAHCHWARETASSIGLRCVAGERKGKGAGMARALRKGVGVRRLRAVVSLVVCIPAALLDCAAVTLGVYLLCFQGGN